MKLTRQDKYYLACSPDENHVPKRCGFKKIDEQTWTTKSDVVANKLIKCADAKTRKYLTAKLEAEHAWSYSLSPFAEEGFQEGLYDYQKAAVEYLLDHPSALLADEMGVGKTVEVLAAINCSDIESVLVVCPASLKAVWRDEIQKWIDPPHWTTVIDDRNTTIQIHEIRTFVIINYEQLIKHYDALRKSTWDLLVVDECQALTNHKSQRSRQVYGHRKTNIEPIPTHRAWFLSGTPLMNRPMELWPILSYLDPETWNSWYYYAGRYCDMHESFGKKNVRGASNVPELAKALRSSIMMRRIQRDCLPELPQKIRQVIEIDSIQPSKAEHEAQKRFDELLQEQKRLKPDDKGFRDRLKKIKGTLSILFQGMSELRHESALEKVFAVAAHAKLVLETEDQIAIFAHHRAVIHRLFSMLGKYDPVVVTGETSTSNRAENIDKFQRGKARVFLGSIKAAGVGITLTAARVGLFAELDWTPAAIDQAEARLARHGQDHTVLCQYIVASGSIDARIARVLAGKADTIEEFMK